MGKEYRSHFTSAYFNDAIFIFVFVHHHLPHRGGRTGEILFGVRPEDEIRYERSDARPDAFFATAPMAGVRDVIASVLPQPPAEITFMTHWLAIDGVQPRIMENTPVQDTGRQAASQAAGKRPYPGAAGPLLKGGAPPAPGRPSAPRPEAVALPLAHDLPGEAQLFVDRLGKALEAFAEGTRATDPAATAPGTPYASALADLDAYAAALAGDAGLQQMLPSLVSLLADQYKAHMRSVPVALALLRLLGALVDNRHVTVDRYLHLVIAVVQGILCNRSLGIVKVAVAERGGARGADPDDPMEGGFALGGGGAEGGQGRARGGEAPSRTRDLSSLEHVVARERAARLLQTILVKYGDATPALRPRVLKMIADQVRMATTPLSTLAGAITGVRLCGGEAAVRSVLLDPMLTQRLERELSDPTLPERPFDHHCLLYCLHAVSQAVQGLPEMRAMAGGGDAPSTPGGALHEQGRGQGQGGPKKGSRRAFTQSFLDSKAKVVSNGKGRGKKGGGTNSTKGGRKGAAAAAVVKQDALEGRAAKGFGWREPPIEIRPHAAVARFFEEQDEEQKPAPIPKLQSSAHFEPCSEEGRFKSLYSSALPFRTSDRSGQLAALHRVAELAMEARMMPTAGDVGLGGAADLFR